MNYDDQVEDLLQTNCYVIDFLPERVPENSPGQFPEIERYYLQHRLPELYRKFAEILLKLNAYYDFMVCFHRYEKENAQGNIAGKRDEKAAADAGECTAEEPAEVWTRNPAPEQFAAWISDCGSGQGFINILTEDDLSENAGECRSLLQLDSSDTHMTIYNPDEKLLRLAGKLAAAEGMHLWEGI